MRLIISIIVIYFAFRGFRSWIRQQFGADRVVSSQPRHEIDDEMVQDPFCRTYVPMRDAIRARIGGNDLYFCSRICRDRYRDSISKS